MFLDCLSRKVQLWRHQLLPIGLDESVYFFCLHKSASSLFGSFVLKHAKGLIHKNYAASIYLNQLGTDQIKFHKRGFIYGPIRLSAEPGLEVYERLVKACIDPAFIKDKKVIIMIRDPRDIIVSSYYSYGYNHRYSPNPAIAEFQKKRRAKIQAQSIDEYAMQTVPYHIEHFNSVLKLLEQCPKALVLRYEDMVDNFDFFARELKGQLRLSKEILDELEEKSRPLQKENLAAHKRNGSVGDYQNKLQKETIAKLNKSLKEQLKAFNYPFNV